MANKENDMSIQMLEEEIAQLKSEKAEMEIRIKNLTNDRNQYSEWWLEVREDNDRLRAIVKTLVTYAKLV